MQCPAIKACKHDTKMILSLCLNLNINGPNISTAQYVKSAASSNLSLGKSATFLTPIFSLSLQQVTHSNTTDFVMELILITQKLRLLSHSI